MSRAFLGIVRKEFIQIFRDINMVRIIFFIPIVQMIIFGYVANTEVEKLALDVYDFDQSYQSREFVQSLKPGDFFIPVEAPLPLGRLEDRFMSQESEMALIIPHGFERDLVRGDSTLLGLIVDGSNANSAAIGIGYARQMTGRFSNAYFDRQRPIEFSYRVLYNPEGKSVYFMVPGVVATLLTMVTTMLTSMAIVREREAGTFEQLMVTPVSRSALLFGKIVPFGIVGIVELMLTLGLGVLWFNVPFVGSPLLLLAMSTLYLFTTLGMGLFFSTVTSTQQQAMFFAWFFSVFAILTSGFFTPVANMPEWMQYVTWLNPMRFFMNIVRSIMMRGAGFFDILRDVLAMVVFGVVIFSMATMRFAKRTA